ncbi:MAG: TrkH family potassium uptake protein [archaeon]
MAELDFEDILTIIHMTSNMMRVIGLALIVPIIVSIIYGESMYAEIFAVMGITLFVAFTMARNFIGPKKVRTKHALISIAVGWFLVGAISSIPFIFHGISPIDAFFESVSGWSGTGLSMIPDPATLPHALNFWRGFIQWMGGFGIVLLALLFYERPDTAQKLFVAEGRNEDFYPSLARIARTIILIYFIYTAIGVLLFWLSGMSIFDSVIHSFTSIATGGFSTNSTGLGFYGMWPMLIGILLMTLGGISFESHYDLFKGKVKRFFSNPEIRFFFAVVAVASILMAINFFMFKESRYFDGVFYIVSAITGTGNTTSLMLNTIPALSVFILILVMIFGACYGSTTGALKLWRILILFRVIRREIYKAFLPQKTVLPIKIGGKYISDDDALKALSYMALYIALIAFGSIFFMLAGYGVVESLFTVASAQGNVGISIIYGAPWFDMNPLFKLLLSLHMIVGRMEIIPFLVMIKGFGVGKKIQ